MSDRLVEKDHDLLVKLVQDVSHLCRKHDQNHAEVREDLKEIHARIDKVNESAGVQQTMCKAQTEKCHQSFLPTKNFWGFLTILVVVMGGMMTFSVQNREMIGDLKSDVAVHTKMHQHENHALDFIIPSANATTDSADEDSDT